MTDPIDHDPGTPAPAQPAPGPPTRGERNNNPCNLEYDGTAWDGLANPPRDGAYCVFLRPGMGIRAGAKDIHNSWKRGRRTIAALLTRFAPPSENATAAYIADVATRTGILADAPLDLDNAPDLMAIVGAIIHHENGRCIYAPELVMAAAQAALTT